MQLRKTPVKELFVSSISSIRKSLTDIKKQSVKAGSAIYRLVVTILFTVVMVLVLLLLPFIFPLIQKMTYKYRVSSLKRWHATYQREWRYQKRRSNRGIYDHPYSEIVNLINENKDSYGLITDADQTNIKGEKA